MKNGFLSFAILAFLGAPAFAGAGSFSQLPGAGEVKAPQDWVSFNVRQGGRSGFSLDDFPGTVSISGYKDFDGNMRFSGRAGDETLSGSFGRDLAGRTLKFELGAIRLQLKRYAVNYKVTGTMPGPGGALVPVNFVIKGSPRGNSYMLEGAGLQLTASENSMTANLAGGADRKFAAAMASLVASLQSDDIFCVLEKGYNYPNPFNLGNGTTLAYKLMEPADYARITVYDVYGRVIAKLDGGTAKGDNQAFWDGRGDISGAQLSMRQLIWQLELGFRGDDAVILKHFVMNLR